MKKRVTAVIGVVMMLIFQQHNLSAQKPELNLGIGYEVVRFTSPSFATMFASYNKQFSQGIKTPFSTQLPNTGNIAYNFRINAIWGEGAGVMFAAEVGYVKCTLGNAVVFKNNDQLHLDYESHVINVGMPLGFAAGSVRICWLNGIIWFSGVLKGYSIYSDGTESCGVENILHGFYDNNRLTWYSGGMLAVGLGSFATIDFSAKYVIKPWKSNTVSTFSDHMEERNQSNFPEDIEKMVSNPFDLNNFLQNDMRGWMLQLRLNFTLRES